MNLQKLATCATAVVCMTGCAPTTTETLLVCEGEVTSLLSGLGGKERRTFEITKTGDKVVQVKSEHRTFKLERSDVRDEKNKGPVYVQLIVDAEKLTLRTEVTEDKKTYDTFLFATGKYKRNQMLGWAEGHCTAGKKAF